MIPWITFALSISLAATLVFMAVLDDILEWSVKRVIEHILAKSRHGWQQTGTGRDKCDIY